MGIRYSATTIKRFSFFLLFFFGLGFSNTQAQGEKDTRILFILDASSSMLQDWQGQTKMQVAKDVLSKSLDSLKRVYPKSQFALRVYGHQSHQSKHDCLDSRLEVPFAKNNISNIRAVLNRIQPMGYTPIAYSLNQASQFDFPNPETFRNIIILITDGLEKCEGDPCQSAKLMQDRGIDIRPKVLGLDLGPEGAANFDCVGEYFAVEKAEEFSEVLDVVVSQTLNTTTAQVNFLNVFGQPKETNISYEIRHQESGKSIYKYVHNIGNHSIPDTVILYPDDKYELTVFTKPPVLVKDVVLESGRHNIIAADLPMGNLNIFIKGMFGQSNVPCLIRSHGKDEILHVQNLNSTERYIAGLYDVEILSTPRIYFDSVEVIAENQADLSIQRWGFLSIFPSEPGVVAVFDEKDGKMRKLWEKLDFREKEDLVLQPGAYKVVFRSNQVRKSDDTQVKELKVTIGKTAVIRF